MATERHSHVKYIVPIVLMVIIIIGGLVMLFSVSTTLTATENTLVTTLQERDAALDEAVTAQSELLTTKSDLSLTQADLSAAEMQLAATEAALDETALKLAQAETERDAASEQLVIAVEQSDTLQAALDALQANYDRTVAGYGYVLKDPTYQQMKAFLAADRTDENEYIIYNYTYVCHDFAADVKANALELEFRCAFVNIDYPGGTGHAIVAFNTTDRGIIYIEPQSDNEVRLEAGKRYYQCIVADPGTYYTAPDYDDTIVRFDNIW